ncbi:hypothetical protein CVT26_009749 [Gymnopilus dilepis]|uniref:F-box domain-containing protein n=1 Tax=Gymnopilus dilepis TaxID=231916 RepID=A0A409YIP7_9AGAR|nr:hypothetical protein CVT26_009749 [Gymnopilus dilepis]
MPEIHIDTTNKSAVLDLISYQPHDQYRAGITLSKPSLDAEFEPPTASLGNLKVLPVEIFDWVIKYATMHAASSLRTVNRQTRLLVDASLPYKHIISSAPHIGATLVRTGVAPHFTVEEVFWILTHPACRVCGNFGMYLWILDLERCCFTCLKEDPNLMPMTEKDARAAFGLTAGQMSQIPVVVSLPGKYKAFGVMRRRTGKFVSRVRARQLGLAIHGDEDGLSNYFTSSNSKAKAAYDKKAVQRSKPMAYDSHGRVNNTLNSVERYLVSVHLPYLDLKTYTTKMGLACSGCQFAVNRRSALSFTSVEMEALMRCRDCAYTEAGIIDHFKECADAQALWNASPCKDELEVCWEGQKVMDNFLKNIRWPSCYTLTKGM